ncbi:MAG TPA: hypothetical protein PKG54_00640 [Phycisphaerae bacterium]|jgi:uncharacterized repeat protein (TIGR04138 family)|nr:hypothetical protein [Phycisphaerae bacterium]HOB73006.1 hypothetical protein [Phycisphaerae bacterium]HOJ52945.1 hypothetical protein [Phycisphaerae bacterium]HOL24682.1 hypothetical protein [Phycisphaerae bacterium]HPP19218.1 hypothetical protein [Phycisphaerae bacterium]
MTQPEKTLEQIVCETGRYPVEGFVFVQECIGAAADAVHGPPSPEMERVAQYMTRKNISLEELRQRYEDGDLPAWLTLLLDRIGGPEKLNRHVTGQQLCWAIRDTALKRWGLLARQVLAHWGITRTEDIGAIVFALVDNGWLSKQPTDSIDDFNHVFSFSEAFDRAYRIKLEGHNCDESI